MNFQSSSPYNIQVFVLVILTFWIGRSKGDLEVIFSTFQVMIGSLIASMANLFDDQYVLISLPQSRPIFVECNVPLDLSSNL